MTYHITLAGDGSTFLAGEDETILDAALAQNIRLPYGCNNGLCFGCLQEITAGETEYREPVMDVGDLLKYQTMLCRAYATSDVVLGGAQLPDLTPPEALGDAQVKLSESSTATLIAETDSAAVNEQDNAPPTINPAIAIQRVADAAHPESFPAKVIANDLLADDTRRVDLQVPQWIDLHYLAGQYIDVLLENGERRSFSIGNADTNSGVLTLYIKQVEQGFFTGYVFDYLTLNTVWHIEAPLGNFVLRDNDRPILMLGGSTGIAPLLAMLEALKHNGDKRRVYVYFGVRFEQRLFVDKALTELALTTANFSYTPVVSRPTAQADCTPCATPWQGRSGYVQTVAIADFGDLSAFDIYISGSPKMVDAATRDCLAAGALHECVYLDVFSYQSEYTGAEALTEVA